MSIWLKRAPLESQGATALAQSLESLGQHARFAGDTTTALRAFQSAAQAAPTAPFIVNFGAALADAGDLDRAYDTTQWALSLDPQNAVAQHNLARFALNLRRPQAQALVDALLHKNADDAQALAFRGFLKAQQGDFSQAQQDFERALAIDPAQQDARDGLALLTRMLRPAK